MFENYFSSIKEMQKQMFHVLAIAACAANLGGVLLNAFLHGNALPTRVCVLCGVAILVFSLVGLFTKGKALATVGILITVVWIEFPLLYSFYGSVILVYFVLSVLGIIIFFPRKFSVPFCSATVVWDIAVVILLHFFVQTEIEMSMTGMLLFEVCSYLIVAIATVFLLNSLILQYEKQKLELKQKNEQLDYMATHDPLTKLYNRGYLMEQMDKRIRQDGASFIYVIMDIDDFKMINDTYGHSFGDIVLATFAKLMAEEVDGQGFAARFGGEEFMIIFDHDDAAEAMMTLRKLANRLEAYFKDNHHMNVTFSGGLEIYNSQKKVDELINSVDTKLYQAKRNGKKQIVC